MANLDPLKARMMSIAPVPGHVTIHDPDVCFYRFAEPTTFIKAATFGVTLGLVVQGAKTMKIGGDVLTIDPSRLVVVTREVEHHTAVIAATDERPYLGLSICFSPERVARALTAIGEAGGAGTPSEETMPAFVMPMCEIVIDAMTRLLRTLDDPLDRKLLSPLVIDEILYRLLRSDAAAAVRYAVGQPGDATRILECMQYIRKHHAKKLSVEGLARELAMSPSHFAHRFTAVARVSPMRYLREVRLERARALLFENGARASDVAAQVGFESAAHFTREFKRRFGAPPARFKKTTGRA